MPLHTHNTASLATHGMQHHTLTILTLSINPRECPQISPLTMTYAMLHETTHMITRKAHPTHATQPVLHKHTPQNHPALDIYLPPQVTDNKVQFTLPFPHPQIPTALSQDRGSRDEGVGKL